MKDQKETNFKQVDQNDLDLIKKVLDLSPRGEYEGYREGLPPLGEIVLVEFHDGHKDCPARLVTKQYAIEQIALDPIRISSFDTIDSIKGDVVWELLSDIDENLETTWSLLIQYDTNDEVYRWAPLN